MDNLPAELIDLLFSYLVKSSIKSLRRTCKSYSELGQPHLFALSTFKLYPNRKRLDQLEELSLHPTIAPRVQTLKYESGVQLEYADYRYWRANVYQAESSKFSRGTITDGISDERYRAFHTALDARFTPESGALYELYRQHLDTEAEAMADPAIISRLSQIMDRLQAKNPSLKIALQMAEPQITLEDLSNFDATLLPEPLKPTDRVRRRHENCLAHFRVFFQSALRSKMKLRSLEAKNLPRELLASGLVTEDGILNKVFRNLSQLDLSLGALPHSDSLARAGESVYHRGRDLAAFRMGVLLRETRYLSFLALAFPPHKKSEFSFDLFERTNIDRFPRTWLPGLEVLVLYSFSCTWADLEPFLHSATSVKLLTLGDGHLETGSMLDLIHLLRSKGLKGVRLDGYWHVFEDGGEWHSHLESVHADQCAHTSYEGPYAKTGLRYQIMRYIIDGGVCPLPTWTIDGHEDQIWEREGDTSFHFIPTPR